MLNYQPKRWLNTLIVLAILLVPLTSAKFTLLQAAPSMPAETGVYTEDFSSYAAKDYTDRVDWNIWSHAFNLRPIDGIGQASSALTRTPDGNMLVVYGEWRQNRMNIYAQKVDMKGNLLWNTAARVNSNSSSGVVWWAESAALAVDSSGAAVIAWSDKRSGNYDVYAQRLDASGNTLWPNDRRVNLTNTSSDYYPTVAADLNGNVVVTWNDPSNVYAQKLDTNGNRLWTTDVRVSSVYPGGNPVVAIDHNDNVAIVWRGGNSFFIQRLDAGGNHLWGAEVQVNLNVGTGYRWPLYYHDVAMDASGNAIVVWDNAFNNDSDIYAQKINTSGTQLWPADIRVNSDNGPAEQYVPNVEVDTGGNAVIVWEDHRNDDGDIYAQKLNSSGNKQWASDRRVNSDTGSARQSYSDLVMDADGNAVVEWGDERNGVGDIYLQRLNANGDQLLTVDACLNQDEGTATQTLSTVATNGNGRTVIAWIDWRDGKPNIYARQIDPTGNRLWTTDVRVNSEAGVIYDYVPPVVGVDIEGNAFIAWQDKRNGDSDIYVERLDTNGNRVWGADVRVNSDTGVADQWAPVASTDGNGNFTVVWWDKRKSDRGSVYAQRLNASGTRLWNSDVRVSSSSIPTTTHLYSPAVAAVPNGEVVVAWKDDRGDPYYDIYAQRLDNSGNRLWATDVRVNSDAGETVQGYPAVAVDFTGRAVFGWQDARDAIGAEIYAQSLDRNGNRVWTNDVYVSGTIDSDTTPAVTIDGSGNAVLAWTGNGGVYGQKINSGGILLWTTEVRVNSDDSTADSLSSGIVVDDSDNAVMVWSDERNGNSDIYAQKINSVGGKGWSADLQVVYPDHYYFPSGVAESRTVDTVSGDIHQATLTANYQLNGGSVEFALSNNGGANWITATLGTATVFTTTGSDLRWRAVLTGDPIWRNRSPLVTSLRIEYSTAVPYADDYEPDDVCSQARPLAVNGAAQAHTFYQYADADWVWFDVISGTTYILQTANPQLYADTTLELRPSCPQPPLDTDDNAFGRDARVTWRATFTGQVYAKVTNHSASVYGANTGYDLSVRTYTQPPVVVIVGGHDDIYSLQSNIDYLSDLAYRTFLNSGVSKANIRYFSPHPNRDVDGNGLNDDIFATATITNVRDAVQDWSRTRGVSLGAPFYLYLVDHGYYDQFKANGDALPEQISATDLNLWLDNLERTSGADNINVILEACKSGSFIDVTTRGPNQISGRNRVVIASTSSTLDAFPSLQGAYFSDVFWTAVGQNQDLKTAFQTAKQAVQATGLSQQPWLDDNGDAVADAQDGTLARGRGLGQSFGDHAPMIDGMQIGDVVSGSSTIQAQIRDDFGVSQAWVVVYPPGFVTPPPSSGSTPPLLNVPTRTLTLTGNDLFSTSFNGFTQTGHYRLVVYAQDAEQHQAAPFATQVCVGCSFVHLPLIRK